MKKIILFAIMLSLLSLYAYAEPHEICNYIKAEAVGKNIPDAAPFKNEVINIYTLDETGIGYLVLQDKSIKSFTCDETGEATYGVYIKDLKTLEDIKSSDNLIDTFKQKQSDKDIIIKGTSVVRKVKLFFAKIALKFF